jgi:hypothetical protein
VYAAPIENEQTFHQHILMHWWNLYELSSLFCSEEDTLEIFPSILDTPCMYRKAFRCRLPFGGYLCWNHKRYSRMLLQTVKDLRL